MLEPVPIPQALATMDSPTTLRPVQTLPTTPEHNVLAPTSSEEWSDKDRKDSMQSGAPSTPPLAYGAQGTHHHHHHLHGHRMKKKASSALQAPRAWMGLQPMAPMSEELDSAHHNHLWWSKVKIALREPFAEFWGTFILVLFGDAAIAQTLLTKNATSAPGGHGFGDWATISWGWGIGLMLGIYVAGDSGAFLNPAICLASCVYRKLPWRRLPMYIIAQLLGAFAAAGVVYGNYINAINAYEGGSNLRTVPPAANATGGIFATYPAADLTKVSGFFDQFLGSALLVFLIYALKDDSNKGKFVASGAWFPLCLFFVMTGIAVSFGTQTGFAINPARDLGPRLMTAALGYQNVWSAGGHYFWIPIVAPFGGALFGGFLYDAFVYTGQSPINTPWFGLSQLVNPKKAITERLEAQRAQDMV